MLLGTVTIAAGQALSIIMRNTTEVFGVPTGGSQGLTGIPTTSTLGWAALARPSPCSPRWPCGAAGRGWGCSRSARTRRSRGRWASGSSASACGASGSAARSPASAGCCSRDNNGVIQPAQLSFANEPLFFIFLMVGGLTTPWGALLGAIAVWWLQELLRYPWSSDGRFLFLQQNDRYWILGALLVLVVLFRPYGLLVRRPLRVPGRRATPSPPPADAVPQPVAAET